jgi:hypothetical protein
MTSPDKIVPLSLQHELQAAAEQADQGYYVIGDIGNRIKEASANLPREKQIPVMEIYKAVGVYAHKASGTIRGYCDVAEFWDQDHRDEFPQFGRHHILAVMPHATGETPEERRASATSVLYKALDRWAEFGTVPTVDGLRAWLREDNGKPAWLLLWERIQKQCRRLLEHRDVPSALRGAVKRLLAVGEEEK